jgi:hypothetical protein
VIVSQTCASAELPDATLLYDEISEAISNGQQLDREFFGDIVSRCAMNRRDGGERYVLVIDEYETLFGRLKTAVMRNHDFVCNFLPLSSTAPGCVNRGCRTSRQIANSCSLW